MSKQRNPEALCLNCPFWLDNGHVGVCRKNSVDKGREPSDWCGDHPDFFLVKCYNEWIEEGRPE